MESYHTPASLRDACAILSQGDATVAAGCTDLFPATERKSLQGPVIDIAGLDDLRGITRDNDGWRIGAAATWTEIRRADLPPAFDMLKEAAREVGSVQIQNAGTIGGNLCNASPAADGVPCLLALDASVTLVSTQGERRLPLADFLTGPRQTALQPGEILVDIRVPVGSAEGRSRFLKLGARRYLVISIAMVAARLVTDGGRIASAAVSVGACSAVAVRLQALETVLIGQPLTKAPDVVTSDLVAEALSPIDDIRADAGYRSEAATELVRRTLRDLAERGAMQ